LTRAQQATELALRILQSLDESHPEKEKAAFTREEYFSHADRICDPVPDGSLLMLGLHLSTYFTVFSSWTGDSASVQVPTSFQFHEDRTSSQLIPPKYGRNTLRTMTRLQLK
jgi:hypothetical protein